MLENIEKNKVLYIGSSFNIQFINDFQNIKDFLIIDNKLPNTIDINFYNIMIEFYKNHGFELLYIEKYDKNKFNIKELLYYIMGYLYVEQSLLIFMNFKTSQQIRYYISTNILNNLNNLIKMEISMCNIIIVNDEIPDIKIFEYFDKPKIFIGNSNKNIENIYEFLYKNDNEIISKYFSDFYFYDENNHKIIKCDDFKDFINIKY